jgi:hypothetical protein
MWHSAGVADHGVEGAVRERQFARVAGDELER